MVKKYSPLLCRYHACDTLRWLHLRDWLQRLMVARVTACSESFTLTLSQETFDCLGEFIKEMDTAYIHPRRDSFHVSLCAQTYSDFVLPGNYLNEIFNVKKTDFLPHPATKKNLSLTA